ncbi:MAG: hypothetical protein V1929_01375 [bacterium]
MKTKTSEQIARELADLIQHNYYDEDFQLLSEVRAYAASLSTDDREILRQVVAGRLADSQSIVDVMLCTVVHAPELVPSLVRMLDRQTNTSQLTRALMLALQRYGGSESFHAVERFLDSDQETEALAVLARIDFQRALPFVFRCLRKDHFLDACLQILFERKKAIGFHDLVDELRTCTALGSASVRERLRLSLTVKKDEYNPFTADEVRTLLAAIDFVE